MTIKQLKELLQEKLNHLEEYDDDQEVDMVSNTYFLHSYHFLGIAGSNGGYIDLDNPVDEDEEEEDF